MINDFLFFFLHYRPALVHVYRIIIVMRPTYDLHYRDRIKSIRRLKTVDVDGSSTDTLELYNFDI